MKYNTSLTLYLHLREIEFRPQFPNQLTVLTGIIDVRSMELDGEMQAFNLFFDELVPCVAGRKVWTLREKATKKISEAGKIVSVLDEAFTILALTNYWDRWLNNGTAKWTDSRAGNYQYMGWTDEAYTTFDALCMRIRNQRKSEVNKRKEDLYLDRLRRLLAGGGAQARREGVVMETSVEVYNELASESESEGED